MDFGSRLVHLGLGYKPLEVQIKQQKLWDEIPHSTIISTIRRPPQKLVMRPK